MPPSAEVLCEELLRTNADPRSSNAVKVQAFESWFRQACVEGKTPDALRRYTEDEIERFASFVIAGVDDHCYWDGPKSFRRNDGRQRLPRRWVWEHHNGPIDVTVDVWTTCGEPNCVAYEHLEGGRHPNRSRYRMTAEQMIGSAQVYYLRHKRTPTQRMWIAAGMKPYPTVACHKFGGWHEFMAAAGLPPLTANGHRLKYNDKDVDMMIKGIRRLAKKLGKRPSYHDWVENREWLVENNLPTSPTTIRRHVGGGHWTTAMDRAGV